MNKETKELIYNPPSIKNLQPHYFRNTSPIGDITASEDEEFSRLSLELMRIYRNNYLNTADENTLGIYEFLYGVTPPYQNKDIYVFLGGENILYSVGGENTQRFKPITNNSNLYPIEVKDYGTHWGARRVFPPSNNTISTYFNLKVDPPATTPYTLSCDVRTDQAVMLSLSIEDPKTLIEPNKWTRLTHRTHLDQGNDLTLMGFTTDSISEDQNPWIEVRNAKIEQGLVDNPIYSPPKNELPEGAEIRYLPANLEVVKLSGSQMISKFISQTVEDNKLYLVENRDIDALVESVNKSAVVDGFVVRVYGTDYITYLPDINVHGERRARLANRESTKPPFTKRFLVNKLDELLGEGNYTLMIDYPNSTIQIESTNPSQSWAEEVYITINNIKPASMVYLNIPVDSNEVIVEEGVNLSQYLYNYRLGTQWVLGKKAFTSFEDLGEVKNMAINSFTPLAHTKAADFLVTQVAKVRLNGDNDKMITTFISKNTVGGIGELVYEVPSSLVTEVNRVDLMDSTNGILSTSNFYVPVPGTTQIKHRFRVRNVS